MNPRYIVILIIFFFAQWQLIAQDKKKELEEDIRRIEEEISFTNQLLNETNKNKELTLNELQILQSQITKRENLIATIQKQLIRIDNELVKSEKEIDKVTRELTLLREEYARMILFAYRNRGSYNTLMFLFASEDFNQAYHRLKYLQQYTVYRQTQIKRIEQAQQQLLETIDRLAKEKDQKISLFDSEKREQISLSTERLKKDKSVQQLSRKESQLRQTIRQKEREAQQLQRAIEDIIAEEIRKANEREGIKNPAPDKLMELTPEELALSNSFTLNKGKLPWPTERGVISAQFGEHPHPVLKKVKTKNNGIDIATSKMSDARCVFEGVVVSVNRITATNNAVIVRHGNYFSVYANLEEVYVKRGDKLRTKELLGRIHTDKSESKTELHFELWQGRQIVNPEFWLAK
ncbi:MAG: peptidoglycan DD-metalloendopeptidase family protein [Bacteroidales bacterium]|nr:peptidoglycan DD-metalloendopeptidase family protein [Bacteroidales bacterium]